MDICINIAAHLGGAFDAIVDFTCPEDILEIVNEDRNVPFDPQSYLSNTNIEAIHGDVNSFFDTAFPLCGVYAVGRVLKFEEREIQALQAVTVVATAFNAKFKPMAHNRYSEAPPPPLPPRPTTPVQALTQLRVVEDKKSSPAPKKKGEQPLTLRDFLPRIKLEHLLEVLEDQGFTHVEQLSKLMEGLGSSWDFEMIMKTLGLSDEDIHDLHNALGFVAGTRKDSD